MERRRSERATRTVIAARRRNLHQVDGRPRRARHEFIEKNALNVRNLDI
jgi:hypothetical protein